MPLSSALGVSIALLLAALLAITAGMRGSDKSTRRADGGPLSVFTAGLAYLIVLAPRMSIGGITFFATVLLIVIVALPSVIAAVSLGLRDRLNDQGELLFDLAGVVVSFVLLVGILAAAGSVLSLFGDLNRLLATAALGVCVTGFLLACGRRGAHRTSRYVIGSGVLALLIFAIGAVVGNPASFFSPSVPSTPLPLAAVAALLLAVIAMGFFDPAAALPLRSAASPGRTALIGTGVLVAFLMVLLAGTNLIYGGALVGPSLQFMTPFAIIPVAALGVVTFIVTFIFAGTADSMLASGAEVAAGQLGENRKNPITVVLGIAAVILAMFVPAPIQIFTVGALFAAAAIGALLPVLFRPAQQLRPLVGAIVGFVLALAVSGVLGIDDALSFNSSTAIALLTAAVAGAVVSAIMATVAAKHAPAAAST